jgi:hypothetical protein
MALAAYYHVSVNGKIYTLPLYSIQLVHNITKHYQIKIQLRINT